jgi:K+-transporting ATPase KdpF subunit
VGRGALPLLRGGDPVRHRLLAAGRQLVTFEYVLVGVISGLGILYLVYVLLWPEKF